ncbi:MAG: anthranilate synthase component [Firmicutes bacterium]|nr:anthranilate synthase component [Bacillota bacterium]
MKLYPDKDEFIRLAEKFNTIPVYADLPADLETPVSLYYKIVGDEPGFMLESAETSKSIGRYSFIGAAPFMTITARKSHIEVMTDGRLQKIAGAPLTGLQGILDGFSFPEMRQLPPFSGGAVGYLTFEAIATWERIRGMIINEDAVLGEYMLCQIVVAMDHLTHSAKLIYLARVDDAAQASAVYEEAVMCIAGLVEKINEELPAMQNGDTTAMPSSAQRLGDDAAIKRRYMDYVERAKEYIRAGDAFQIVPSHPFRRKLTKAPFELYRRLRRLNPSPYMFYINFGRRRLVGASPERLVKLQDFEVQTCPIAGTRPRGKTPEEDERLAAELLCDPKELAEHAMLVDIGRNDIGRISLPGTVKVSRMMQVETFSHVMHIVSEVTGRVDPKYKPTEVLASCFPAGTLSGAPKIRAVEIINELENTPRGAYGGAVGYFDFRGNMDTCITIRTMAIDGDEVVVQSGGGIVADSVPETEYQEILHKAGAMFGVLGGE